MRTCAGMSDTKGGVGWVGGGSLSHLSFSLSTLTHFTSYHLVSFIMTSTGEWTVLEKLLLAQAVYKFGEDDWVHIARNLRQHTMLNRPPEFFNQKASDIGVERLASK